MTFTYFPFDSGAGQNVIEAQWGEMARLWLCTGVCRFNRSHIDLNLFEVYADNSGLQVKVKSGTAWIEGFYVKSDAETIVTLATADATNPRIDRIILRLDRSANTISLTKLTGTPAGSPSAPALTQNSTTWEISLAKVTVAATDTLIAAGDVTDERTYVLEQFFRPKSTNAAEVEQILIDQATIAWDCDLGAAAKVTLGGNRTLAAPTNMRAGATYIVRFIQDATGNRTITWNAVYKFPGGIDPVLSTGANAVDLISFYCDGTSMYGGSLLRSLA